MAAELIASALRMDYRRWVREPKSVPLAVPFESGEMAPDPCKAVGS